MKLADPALPPDVADVEGLADIAGLADVGCSLGDGPVVRVPAELDA